MAGALSEAGRQEESLSAVHRAIEICEQIGWRYMEPRILSNIGNNKLAIYITPNYDSWTDEDVREANGCIDGAGANSALKVFDDYILWGHPGCSSGAAPMKDSEAYVGFEECMEAGNKLTEYLRSS